MNLYHVQDDDRPVYVLASSWEAALAIWREKIRAENEDVDPEELDLDPAGILFVAKDDEILFERRALR